MYFIGRGSIVIGDRNSDGSVGALRDVGEVPMFEFNIETQYADNFETRSAVSRQDLHVMTQQSGKGSIQLKEHTAKNLALALYGEDETSVGGSFSAQAFPTGIVSGEIRQVPGARLNLSAVTIVDSAGTPTTLVLGSDYSIDLKSGLVTFLDVSGLTQPFKISGTEGASSTVKMLTKRASEKVLIFSGINIADNDAPCIIQLHRIATEPAQKITGKSTGNDVATMEISFSMLHDSTKSDDALLGSYGAYRQV